MKRFICIISLLLSIVMTVIFVLAIITMSSMLDNTFMHGIVEVTPQMIENMFNQLWISGCCAIVFLWMSMLLTND